MEFSENLEQVFKKAFGEDWAPYVEISQKRSDGKPGQQPETGMLFENNPIIKWLKGLVGLGGPPELIISRIYNESEEAYKKRKRRYEWMHHLLKPEVFGMKVSPDPEYYARYDDRIYRTYLSLLEKEEQMREEWDDAKWSEEVEEYIARRLLSTTPEISASPEISESPELEMLPPEKRRATLADRPKPSRHYPRKVEFKPPEDPIEEEAKLVEPPKFGALPRSLTDDPKPQPRYRTPDIWSSITKRPISHKPPGVTPLSEILARVKGHSKELPYEFSVWGGKFYREILQSVEREVKRKWVFEKGIKTYQLMIILWEELPPELLFPIMTDPDSPAVLGFTKKVDFLTFVNQIINIVIKTIYMAPVKERLDKEMVFSQKVINLLAFDPFFQRLAPTGKDYVLKRYKNAREYYPNMRSHVWHHKLRSLDFDIEGFEAHFLEYEKFFKMCTAMKLTDLSDERHIKLGLYVPLSNRRWLFHMIRKFQHIGPRRAESDLDVDGISIRQSHLVRRLGTTSTFTPKITFTPKLMDAIKDSVICWMFVNWMIRNGMRRIAAEFMVYYFTETKKKLCMSEFNQTMLLQVKKIIYGDRARRLIALPNIRSSKRITLSGLKGLVVSGLLELDPRIVVASNKFNLKFYNEFKDENYMIKIRNHLEPRRLSEVKHRILFFLNDNEERYWSVYFEELLRERRKKEYLEQVEESKTRREQETKTEVDVAKEVERERIRRKRAEEERIRRKRSSWLSRIQKYFNL